jgi:DNA-binding response OmpR family regulator
MSKKVLVVNNTISHLHSPQLLIEEGYSVDVVPNSDAGLQHLAAQDYNLVIVQESRETESWQLCEKIRRLSRIPLIVISTNASADTCVKAINAGADYFMRKPFGPLEFLARVQCLLQRTVVNQSAPVGS